MLRTQCCVEWRWGEGLIDAASFTAIRLLSGAIVLMCLILFSGRSNGVEKKGGWLSSLWLFLYALSFSFASVLLDTGTGVLILFASVQITMTLFSIYRGAQLRKQEWLGLVLQFGIKLCENNGGTGCCIAIVGSHYRCFRRSAFGTSRS